MRDKLNTPNEEIVIEKSSEKNEEIKKSNTVKEIQVSEKYDVWTLQPPKKVNEFQPYLSHLLITPKWRKNKKPKRIVKKSQTSHAKIRPKSKYLS